MSYQSKVMAVALQNPIAGPEASSFGWSRRCQFGYVNAWLLEAIRGFCEILVNSSDDREAREQYGSSCLRITGRYFGKSNGNLLGKLSLG